MVTISLDEFGEFEKEDNKPLFIAGILFDDGEDLDNPKNEEALERKRIEAYYRSVIADVGKGARYPEDLHSNGDHKRDRNIIRPVKKKVYETLGEFISNGTYNGKALTDQSGKVIQTRQGKYSIFVMLKSDDGKKGLLSENANMLAKDDWAANRYFHMASSVVNRIIFHNPLYESGAMPAINIDIATRSTGNIDKMDRGLKEEFEKEAYTARNSNQKYYSIMNADIYRTLIAQEMVNCENTSVKINRLKVSSIQYHSGKSNMEFLYLSDSLCSVLGFDLKGETADKWLEQILERVEKLNATSENLVFGYDEIDNSFAKAWNLFEQRNLFESLSVAFDAQTQKGKFAEHYRDYWFPYLEKRVRESVTPDLFTMSVNNLSTLLNTNNLDQEKLLYLMQQFELMVDSVSGQYRSIDDRARILYKLYDVGVSAFCHIGNATKALGYYEKCRKYAYYIGVGDFLNTNNKLIVCLEDSFEWKKAIELSKDNVFYQQQSSQMKREIFGKDDTSGFLDEARTISQLARVYAEMRDERAEKHFKEALEMLERESANYKITQSYLLHYYADMGLQDAFDEEAQKYFDGNNTYEQRLDYLIDLDEESHSLFSKKYALYVLIRGLYYFHQDEIDESFWTKLRNLDKSLADNTGKEPCGHPWEITYKYLEMLAIKKNDEFARKKFRKLKSDSIPHKGEIIEAIEKYGEAEVADLEQQYDLRDEITQELCLFMKENYEVMRNVDIPENGTERYQMLTSYFTFMYR